MFGLFSVMFNVFWSMAVASNVQLLLRREGVTDTAVIVMMILYAWIIGLIFAAYGVWSARIFSLRKLPLMLTGLLSLLCGLGLWIVGLQGSGGNHPKCGATRGNCFQSITRGRSLYWRYWSRIHSMVKSGFC